MDNSGKQTQKVLACAPLKEQVSQTAPMVDTDVCQVNIFYLIQSMKKKHT